MEILSTDDESKEWTTNRFCKANRNELDKLPEEERKQFVTQKIESLKKLASDLELHTNLKEQENQLYNEWMNDNVNSDFDEKFMISQDMLDSDIQMNFEN